MRALICRQWGDVDQLKVAEVPSPVPTETEILIDVETTALVTSGDGNGETHVAI